MSLIILLLSGLAATATAPAPPLIVDENFTHQALGLNVDILRDPQQSYSIVDVLDPDAQPGFTRATRLQNSFGYGDDAIWMRFLIMNRLAHTRRIVVVIDYPQLDDVRLFVARAKRPIQSYFTGDLLAFSQRPVFHREFVFPIDLPPGLTRCVLRVASTSPRSVPLHAYSTQAYDRHQELQEMLLWMYYGLLLGMIFYNLIVYAWLRDRSVLYLVLFLFFFGLFQFTHNGLGKQFLWPGPGPFNARALMASGTAAATFLLLFCRNFLHTRRTLPKMDRWMRVLVGVLVGGALFNAGTYWPPFERVSVLFAFLTTLVVLVSGGVLLWRGVREARLFFIAWAIFFVGTGAGLLKAVGLLPLNLLTSWGFQIGSAVAALTLALALADRINIQRREIERFNRGLEILVEQRTVELRETSQNLEQQRGELERAYQDLLRETEERKALEAQLLQAQKMEAIGRLAGGVAHDINNVLAAIMGFASLIEQSLDLDHPARSDLHEILASTARGRDLTTNLLGFARKGSIEIVPVDVNRLLGELHSLLKRTAPKNIDLDLDAHAQKAFVEGDPSQLMHAIMNLCVNAIDAMPSGGQLKLSVEIDDTRALQGGPAGEKPPDRGQVIIEVRDSGEGMTDEVRDRAFEPFFTTKPQGKGTGLGLSMVYGTIGSYGGAVTLDSRPGQGTTVRLSLPQKLSAADAPGDFDEGTALVLGSGTILVIDDEKPLLKMAQRMLGRLGYRTVLADSGQKGLDLFEHQASNITAVLLDLMMPGMPGDQVFREIRQRRPGFPILVCSGYANDMQIQNLTRDNHSGFISKPFNLRELSNDLHEILAATVIRPA